MDSTNTVRTIDTNEQQLNDLFKEVLDGLRDDIIEAQTNVKQYQDIIGADVLQLATFGTVLNQALSVKGSARDRCLKFLNTFKDRVTKKEAVELAKEIKNQQNVGGMDHSEMNKLLEELKNSGKLNNMTIDFQDEDDV